MLKVLHPENDEYSVEPDVAEEFSRMIDEDPSVTVSMSAERRDLYFQCTRRIIESYVYILNE